LLPRQNLSYATRRVRLCAPSKPYTPVMTGTARSKDRISYWSEPLPPKKERRARIASAVRLQRRALLARDAPPGRYPASWHSAATCGVAMSSDLRNQRIGKRSTLEQPACRFLAQIVERNTLDSSIRECDTEPARDFRRRAAEGAYGRVPAPETEQPTATCGNVGPVFAHEVVDLLARYGRDWHLP